jgi:hypothetical protein
LSLALAIDLVDDKVMGADAVFEANVVGQVPRYIADIITILPSGD